MRGIIVYFSIFLMFILLAVNTYLFLYHNEDFRYLGASYLFTTFENVPTYEDNILTDLIDLLSKNEWITDIDTSIDSLISSDWGLFNWVKPIFSFFGSGLVTALAVTQNIALLLSIIVFYISNLFVYIFYFFQALFV